MRSDALTPCSSSEWVHQKRPKLDGKSFTCRKLYERCSDSDSFMSVPGVLLRLLPSWNCIAQHFRHDQPHTLRVLHVAPCITNRAVPLSMEKRKSMTEKTCKILACKIDKNQSAKKKGCQTSRWGSVKRLLGVF